MSKRKAGYTAQPFETNGHGKAYAALYVNQLTSPAYTSMSKGARLLYVYAKAQFFGERDKPNNDSQCFTLNRRKVLDYGLYTSGNLGQFQKDLEELILHGFITCEQKGALTREKSVYRFCSGWQRYPNYEPTPAQMTAAMVRRLKKTSDHVDSDDLSSETSFLDGGREETATTWQ